MVQIIKNLWNKWENLKTWQQVLLLIPFILLTILLIVYIFFPYKFGLEKELLKHNKETADKHINSANSKEDKLEKKQKEIKDERIKAEQKLKEEEDRINDVIKEIDSADDNISKLLALHERLNTRK